MVGKGSLVSPCDGAGLPAGSSESYPPEGVAMLQTFQAFRIGPRWGAAKMDPIVMKDTRQRRPPGRRYIMGPCVVPYDWPPVRKPISFRHTRAKDRERSYRKD